MNKYEQLALPAPQPLPNRGRFIAVLVCTVLLWVLNLFTFTFIEFFGSNAFKRRTKPEHGFRFKVWELLEPDARFRFGVQSKRL